MKKLLVAVALWALCVGGAAWAGPGQTPPQQQQQQFTNLEGTVTAGGSADAGAHVYLLAADGDPVTSANLDEQTSKAFQHEDADANGKWQIFRVYAANYRLVVVSAHADKRIWETPVVLYGTEYSRTIDHAF